MEPHGPGCPGSVLFGCELTANTKSYTFQVDEEDDSDHILALSVVCLTDGAKDECNVVEVVGRNHENQEIAVPVANLKLSCQPLLSLDNFKLQPPVTFRLAAGSGPVHLAGWHRISKMLPLRRTMTCLRRRRRSLLLSCQPRSRGGSSNLSPGKVLIGTPLPGWLLPRTPLARTSTFAALGIFVCLGFFFCYFFSVVTFWGAGAAPSTWVAPFPQPWEADPKTGSMLLVYPLSPIPMLGVRDGGGDPCPVPFCCPEPLLCAPPLPSSETPVLALSPADGHKASGGTGSFIDSSVLAFHYSQFDGVVV